MWAHLYVVKFSVLQVYVNTSALFLKMLVIIMVIVISEALLLREGFYKGKPSHFYLIFVKILHCVCVL